MRNQFSFSRQLLLLSLLPMLILTIAFTLFYLQDRFNALDEQLAERGHLFVRQAAVTSEYGIFTHNQSMLREMAQSLLDQQGSVEAVLIFDADRGLLVHERRSAHGDAGLDRATRLLQQSVQGKMCGERAGRILAHLRQYMVLCAPVRTTSVSLDDTQTEGSTMDIGYAGVVVERTDMLRSRSQLIEIATILCLLLALASLLIQYVIRRRVIAPIEALSSSIDKIGHGDLKTEVNVFSEISELRNLSYGIDLMRRDLLVEREQLERRIAEATAKLKELAYYDALTGLPNRRMFMEHLEYALVTSRRDHSYGAVMFLDMDKFKAINDQYGHEAGDKLLVEAGARISAALREGDVVARFGGDEFAVLLPSLSVFEQEAALAAGRVAEKVRQALSRPYNLQITAKNPRDSMILHHGSGSIGVTLFQGHDLPDEIFKCADDAMYRAKAQGRNQVQVCPGLSLENVPQ